MTVAQKSIRKSFFRHLWAVVPIALLVCWALPASWATAQVRPTFLYKLSDFDGPVPFKTARIFVDNLRNEIYVADTRQGEIRIFNEQGMEVYRFGDDGSLGAMIDLAVSKSGEIFVLTRYDYQPVIVRCDFKGRPLDKLKLKDLPPEFASVLPNKLTYWNDRLFLLDTISLKLVVTDTNGLFQKGYDIARLAGIDQKKRQNSEIAGFSVDPNGNILFTIPVMFSAYRLSPEGEVLSFGQPGSAPGRFGVVVDIVADEQGYYFVADRLKSVVLIFDPDFKFLAEFGYRGRNAHNLISPGELGLDAQGRLYISQLGNRGVSVFRITHQQ